MTKPTTKPKPAGPLAKLPPLRAAYQFDDYFNNGWVQSWTAQNLKTMRQGADECKGCIVIRRVKDGKIVYRNKAARAAGIGGRA